MCFMQLKETTLGKGLRRLHSGEHWLMHQRHLCVAHVSYPVATSHLMPKSVSFRSPNPTASIEEALSYRQSRQRVCQCAARLAPPLRSADSFSPPHQDARAAELTRSMEDVKAMLRHSEAAAGRSRDVSGSPARIYTLVRPRP